LIALPSISSILLAFSAMALTDPGKVESRYRTWARCYYLVCFAVVALILVHRVSNILWFNLDTPPVVNSVEDCSSAANVSRCYPMPYVVLTSPKPMTSCIGGSHVKDAGLSWLDISAFFDGDIATNLFSDGKACAIDLTGLVPKFGSGAFASNGQVVSISTLIAPVVLRYPNIGTFGMEISVISLSPKIPLDIKNESVVTSAIRSYGVAHTGLPACTYADGATINRMDVSLSMAAKPGRYLGFSRQADHMETTYALSARTPLKYGGGQWDNGRSGMALYFMVSSGLVNKRSPVSAISQVAASLSSLGGYLAFIGTAFAALFVRAYPKSKAERINEELTFIGHSRKERPLLHAMPNDGLCV